MNYGPANSQEAGVKLWHDDVRPPPDDTWTWTRTNEQAVELLRLGGVTEASLDHDLGLHDLDPDTPGVLLRAGGSEEGSGYDLVRWMCESGHLPDRVRVHSWNPGGARRMAARLREAGCNVRIEPFRLER